MSPPVRSLNAADAVTGWALLWVGCGNPVVSRCSTTGYKPAPRAGCDFVGCEVPVVSLVPSSTTGYKQASLRDEEASGEGAPEDGFAGEKCDRVRGGAPIRIRT